MKIPDTDGSPASAGIDPLGGCDSRQWRWFPRKCGDRPSIGELLTGLMLVPPQVRG